MLSGIPVIGFLLMSPFLSRTMFVFCLDHGAHNKLFFNCNTGYEICITVYNEKKKTRDLSLIRFTCDVVDPSVGPLVNMKKHLIYAMYQCHSNNGKSFRSFVSQTHILHYLCYVGLQHKGHLAVIASALEGENWS